MVDAAEALPESNDLGAGTSYLDSVLTALRRLDRLLEQAVAAAQVAYGPEAAVDRFRGLYISQSEAERLLRREPGVPVLWTAATAHRESEPDSAGDTSLLAWLQYAFDLSPFDMDLLLLALAVELDLRYERLFAYLQDDVTRKRPSVEFALNLLCTSKAEKLARRAHFGPDAPLVHHGLLHVIADVNQVQPPLLAHSLKLDEQIVRLLLGARGIDPRVVPLCERVEPAGGLDDLPLDENIKQTLSLRVIKAREVRQPLRLYFQGPQGSGKRRTAEAVAGKVGAPLLVVDMVRALAANIDFEQVVKILFREAWFQEAILYFDGVDLLHNEERAISYQYLLNRLLDDTGIAILAGVRPWLPSGRSPTGVITVPFPIPDFAKRRDCWHADLAAEGIVLEASDLEALAERFRLTPGQIADAVATARNCACWRVAAASPDSAGRPLSDQLTLADLFAAARAQSGHDLAALARKIMPKYTWDDLVLPADALAQLRELCQRVVQRHRVLDEWGFDRKLSLGKGANALFAGPSGTGKTMAAEIVANELGLDLYKIDLSSVVSKWIGETEKNLDHIFTASENANAILFFDEADALFGKRSEVRDSHDRYANIEISYLLQKMEQYEGIAILATNLRGNLDEAFVRRLAFTVHFPFPDEASRQHIWASIWPVATLLASDVNLDFLARQFKLSGGNIKNIALAAAFLAAEDNSLVTMGHLLHATRREYQKMGKALGTAELGAYAQEVSV